MGNKGAFIARSGGIFFMKICPKCDAQNSNTAPVCKNCGANLNETPTIEDAVVKDEKPPYNLGLSLFLFIVSFVASASKYALDLDMEYLDISEPQHIIYFIMVIISVVTCVFGFVCLKGVFKIKQSLPGIGILAILVGVVCAVLVFLDILSIILMI